MINQLPELKSEEWIKSIPSGTLQQVVERLDTSYQNYFRKHKSGEIKTAKAQYIAKRFSKGLEINYNKLNNFGKPKWAKKAEYNSIVFIQNDQSKLPIIRINNNKINLPKIGELLFFKDRVPTGKIKIATIIKENNAFYISVSFEYESKNLYPTNENQVVGIDMGITHFCVDSNENYVPNPTITKKYENKLRVKNRSLSRKTVGSNRFLKTKSELQNLYKKISNTRKDELHKKSFEYVKNNSLIVCEDLKVKNMVQKTHLSKSISDASWSKFFGMLKYKSQAFEKDFIQVNPKFTSQKCSNCGHTCKENRKTQEKFECVMCGHKANADFNASKIILGEGIALKHKREALACA